MEPSPTVTCTCYRQLCSKCYILYMCCEYPHPPTLPLPGLITDSFGKLRNKDEALKEDCRSDLHSVCVISDNRMCTYHLVLVFTACISFLSLSPLTLGIHADTLLHLWSTEREDIPHGFDQHTTRKHHM